MPVAMPKSAARVTGVFAEGMFKRISWPTSLHFGVRCHAGLGDVKVKKEGSKLTSLLGHYLQDPPIGGVRDDLCHLLVSDTLLSQLGQYLCHVEEE